MRLLKKFAFFSKIFQSLQRVPSVFLIFLKTEWLLTNFKEPPFTGFGIARFSKLVVFVLKLGFLKFFLRQVFFLCDIFKICFHRSPPQFLLETKRFASIKDYSRFSATYRRPSSKNFSKKNFEKKFFRKKFEKKFSKNFVRKKIPQFSVF